MTPPQSVQESARRESEILLVSDDPHTLRTMDWALSARGYQITAASSGLEAVELLKSRGFNLVIVALHEKVADGISAISKARQKDPGVRSILLADYSDVADAFDALRFLGVDDCIWKPCSLSELLDRVTACLERWESQKESKRSEEEATAKSQEILRLLTMMSHDIRGALISIGAGLKLLGRGTYGSLDGGASDKAGDLCERVKKVVGLAEEFLGKAFSLTEKTGILEEALDLKQDVIHPVLSELSAEMLENSIKVDNRLDSEKFDHVAVRADAIWLKAVFRNLFRNAMKYGGHGCTISIGFENKDSFYRLSVSNSGRPIPEEKRGRLFRRFSRLASAGKGGSDGMGVGLYMVREIVRKHGGDIWYEAAESGSNFIFTLPQK